MTAGVPKSGEQQDQIAPMDAHARNATTASCELGRKAATLSPTSTPISLRFAAKEPVFFSSSCQLMTFSPFLSDLETKAAPSPFLRKTCSAKLSSAPSNHSAPGIFLLLRTG